MCDSIDKEVRYTKDFMGLMKAEGEVKTEKYKVEIEIQEENV